MELKEARYILAIARHQSIGKAAESLYISQPSLSKYLKNLEERLGAPLFSRHENRYYPTYMGERYLHYAEQIVACGDEWMQEYCALRRSFWSCMKTILSPQKPLPAPASATRGWIFPY